MKNFLIISNVSDVKLDSLTHDQLKNLVRDCRADAQAFEKNVTVELKDTENQLETIQPQSSGMVGAMLSDGKKDYLRGYYDALVRVERGGFTAETYKEETE